MLCCTDQELRNLSLLSNVSVVRHRLLNYVSDMPIEMSFDMPYSLRVDGDFVVRTAGEEFNVTLSTHFEENPRFPGAETVENVAIVHDDTNILSHTKVIARYNPSDPATVPDEARFVGYVAEIAISVANALVSAARAAYQEYFLDYIYAPKRLGPIDFSVSAIEGVNIKSGRFDALMGGITFRTPPRSGHDTLNFGRVLAEGATLTVAQELYFDARQYLLRGNYRMALANLVISFEVGLADSLSKIAVSRADTALEALIVAGTLGELGQNLAKQALGQSLEKKSYWGGRFSVAYTWLTKSRNGVLHKAQMSVTHDSVTRDFSIRGELEALFDERDWLTGEIEAAVARVIAGQPAKP